VVLLLLESRTWARRLSQSPELGLGFCLSSSWSDFDFGFVFWITRRPQSWLGCCCATVRKPLRSPTSDAATLDQLERARQAAERETLREKLKAEQKRLGELLEMAENCRRARTLREFLAACREEGRTATAGTDAAFEAWLKWGEEQANRLDPLADSEPSILDKAEEPR